MGYKVKSSVCLIAFNRPEHTEQVLGRISEVQPSRLFVVCDGPRADRPGEEEACERVVELIKEGVTWDCDVSWKVREENAGCRTNVSEGISWFFQQEDEGIILEDDCVPDVSFFRYCDELLDRFREDPSVVCISGSCHSAAKLKKYPYSYYFSIFNHCWGWASWSRAWSHYDDRMEDYSPERCLEFLCSELGMSKRHADAWVRRFTSVVEGHLDTWDYVWTYSCWMQKGITCLPPRNLVQNIGFDELATHTQTGFNYASRAYSIDFPLRHPPEDGALKMADKYVQDNFYTRGFFTRVRQKIVRKVLPRFFGDGGC